MENNLKNTINNIVNKIFNKSLDVEPLILLSDDLPLIKKLNDSIIINDYTVFINSLTHKSFDDKNNYEVLECLGDGYLKGIIINAIIEEFPTASEGYITEVRFTLENTETFAQLLNSEFNELINFIRYDENKIYKNQINKIYEDVFEAFIGALISFAMSYDQNLISYICIFYKNLFVKHIQSMKLNKQSFDISYVKKLAIYCNKYKKNDPVYTTINKYNTDNGAKIYVKLIVDDIEIVKFGSSIKDAQKKCAEEMLNILKNHKSKNINIKNICWFD